MMTPANPQADDKDPIADRGPNGPGGWRGATQAADVLAGDDGRPHDPPMSDVTRHEMNARLEATETRMASATDAIRADMNALRTELAAQAKVAQASADAFYAKAGSVLSEIHLANEKHKNAIYGIGYRVIAWTLGTILAVGSIVLGAFRAYMALQGGG